MKIHPPTLPYIRKVPSLFPFSDDFEPGGWGHQQKGAPPDRNTIR